MGITQGGWAQNVLLRQNLLRHLARMLVMGLQLHLNPVHEGPHFGPGIRYTIALNTTPNPLPDSPHVLCRMVILLMWLIKTIN